MRLVSGLWRGQKLYVPEGDHVRPTSERARAALIDILHARYGGDWASIKFADLCAGSGAVGIEMLSRGASFGIFVEHDPTALTCLRKNLSRVPKEHYRILAHNAERLNAWQHEGPFHIIFMDPPYKTGLGQQLLTQIMAVEAPLTNDGLLVVELDGKETITSVQSGWSVVMTRRYGRNQFVMLQKN